MIYGQDSYSCHVHISGQDRSFVNNTTNQVTKNGRFSKEREQTSHYMPFAQPVQHYTIRAS